MSEASSFAAAAAAFGVGAVVVVTVAVIVVEAVAIAAAVGKREVQGLGAMLRSCDPCGVNTVAVEAIRKLE